MILFETEICGLGFPCARWGDPNMSGEVTFNMNLDLDGFIMVSRLCSIKGGGSRD